MGTDTEGGAYRPLQVMTRHRMKNQMEKKIDPFSFFQFNSDKGDNGVPSVDDGRHQLTTTQ